MKSGNLNPLNAELNPMFHLLALLGAHPILHVSRVRVNFLEPSGPVEACNGAALPLLLTDKLVAYFGAFVRITEMFLQSLCSLQYLKFGHAHQGHNTEFVFITGQ